MDENNLYNSMNIHLRNQTEIPRKINYDNLIYSTIENDNKTERKRENKLNNNNLENQNKI